MGAQVFARHRGEEVFAHQLADHREGLPQGLGQRDGDVVAVDVEAVAGGPALGIGQAGRDGASGVEEGGAERGLGHAVAPCRMRAAQAASPARTGQSGTSLSHSISVGFGPPAAMVRS